MNIQHLTASLLVAGAYLIAANSPAIAQPPQYRWQAAPELAPPSYTAKSSSGPLSHLISQQHSPAMADDYSLLGNDGCGAGCAAGCNGGCGGGCSGGCGGNCGTGCDAACGSGGLCEALDPCHDRCGHLFALGELTLFRYHRADGVRVGADPLAGEDVEFNFNASPRVTIGYAGSDGFGVRFRWWDFDHHQLAQDETSWIGVDTYNLDLEVFDTISLNECWMLQVSGGVRWNEFDEQMFDSPEGGLRINEFRGFGGLLGAEMRRCIGAHSAIFAGAKLAVLMDDKFVVNVNLPDRLKLTDSVQGMVEIAMGYELTLAMDYNTQVFARVAGEWQNWYNYSSAFSPLDGEDAYGGASDVGFGGISVSLGIGR